MAFSKLMIFDSHVLGMFAHSIIQIKTVLFNISDCFSGPILKIICWGDICITRLPQCLISSLGIMLKHWNVGPALGQHEINITWASMGHYWASGQNSGGPISKCQYWPDFFTYIGPSMAQWTYVTWVAAVCGSSFQTFPTQCEWEMYVRCTYVVSACLLYLRSTELTITGSRRLTCLTMHRLPVRRHTTHVLDSTWHQYTGFLLTGN